MKTPTIAVLIDAARRIVEQHETLALSERDRRTFFDVLANPPEPDETLKKAHAVAGALIGP